MKNRFELAERLNDLDQQLQITKGDWQPDDLPAQARWTNAQTMAMAALTILWRHDIGNQHELKEERTLELGLGCELAELGLRILEGN